MDRCGLQVALHFHGVSVFSLFPQFPNMVNFLMLLSLMTDEHFTMFFRSLQSYIENTFGVFHNTIPSYSRVLIPIPSYHRHSYRI